MKDGDVLQHPGCKQYFFLGFQILEWGLSSSSCFISCWKLRKFRALVSWFVPRHGDGESVVVRQGLVHRCGRSLHPGGGIDQKDHATQLEPVATHCCGASKSSKSCCVFFLTWLFTSCPVCLWQFFCNVEFMPHKVASSWVCSMFAAAICRSWGLRGRKTQRLRLRPGIKGPGGCRWCEQVLPSWPKTITVQTETTKKKMVRLWLRRGPQRFEQNSVEPQDTQKLHLAVQELAKVSKVPRLPLWFFVQLKTLKN